METVQIVRWIKIAKIVVQIAFFPLMAIAVITSMLVRASGLDHFDAATGRTFKIEYGRGGEFPVYVWPWAGELFWILGGAALLTGALFVILRLIVRRIDRI